MNNWMYIFGLLLISFTACKQESAFYVDPALEPYFDLFAQEAEARGLSVDFAAAEIETAFVDLDNGIPGQCAHSEASPNLLRIDPSTWESYSDWEKEFLIFHELGHCYLGLGHNDAKDEQGNCQSIMHSSTLICTNTFVTDRTELLNELFNNE